MSSTALPEMLGEHDPSRQWRLQELERAGYPHAEALELSGRTVDLHLAIGLLEQGCPVETAMRILV